MSRILVIGSTGNVGRHVVSQLSTTGSAVRALARNPNSAANSKNVEIVCGDLAAPESLDAALDGVDSVFLVWTAPPGTAAAVIERIASRARKIVYLSAPIRTQHPFFQASLPNAGATLNAELERLIIASGMAWTFVRPGMFAGNSVGFWAGQIRAGNVVRWPYVESPTAPIDERDIAAVAVSSLLYSRHEGGDYVITGPESLTQTEQVEAIGRAIGRELRVANLSPEDARRELTPAFPLSVLNILMTCWAAAIGQPAHVTSTFAEVTGRPPRTFAEWARDYVEEFRI
ncbi:MAG TPA: NAD(P)H-binding protein [Candidatus Solibacter sp.]|nr:NAD(P)H-binding protein [Candidatus Solibacter sp.]